MRGNLTVGILAHVDAGKTTLSEALLYTSGALRRLGRVDHQNAFLDTDAMERQQGITIFSKQAVMPLGEGSLTMLDTPGHVDFSAETERVLSVLDYAILVINGADGVQSHTLTLWQLLKRQSVPVFLFINKMDLPAADGTRVAEQLRHHFGEGFVRFSAVLDRNAQEEIALCDEGALTEFLKDGGLGDGTVSRLIRARQVFPCYFGSALRLEGVEPLLAGLERFAAPPAWRQGFSARVFKISRDDQGARLTHLRVTGGALKVRDSLRGSDPKGGPWDEKVTQIRLYSGARFRALEEAAAGTVCCVTGLSFTYPGEGLGEEADARGPQLTPVLSYRVALPAGMDPAAALGRLRELQEEDPQLSLSWSEQTQEIRLQLMGEVQLEVLGAKIEERFGFSVSFDAGRVLYRETITEPVIGMGHFEPLRHYAEVHLLLQPLPRGSGLVYESICLDEVLGRSWQRLVLSHLEEADLRGVLVGAPITDMKITLLSGRAHNRHTQGGDFREAALRALRQGLMKAESCLLEPVYAFRMELPAAALGRAMFDLQKAGEDIKLEENDGQKAVLSGRAPVSFMRAYAFDLREYTRGAGSLSLQTAGYAPCPKQDEAAAASGYDPEGDLANTADSVFCSQGAGVAVKWYQADSFMHLGRESYPEPYSKKSPAAATLRRANPYQASPEEVQAIFERTYGAVRRESFEPVRKSPKPEEKPVTAAPANRYEKPDYLLVDGYNIIHAWKGLSDMAQSGHMDAARQTLMNRLSGFRVSDERELILVFDAYRVQGEAQRVDRFQNISVVYTKEAETADAYIEKVSYEIGKKHRVTVATGDSVIQLIALGHGALRISPAMLLEEVERSEERMRGLIRENNRPAAGRMSFPEGFDCGEGLQ